MENPDTQGGNVQRLQDLGIDGLGGGGDILSRQAQRFSGQVLAVEAIGVFHHRRIAARLHIGQNGGDTGVDINRGFPLTREQSGEGGFKISLSACKFNQRHRQPSQNFRSIRSFPASEP